MFGAVRGASEERRRRTVKRTSTSTGTRNEEMWQTEKFPDVDQHQHQGTKSRRWMPRHQTTMKDVATDETLRGGGEQPLIRRSPNGITHAVEDSVSCAEYIGV